MLEIIVITGFLLLFAVVAICSRHKEIVEFNKGKCLCGGKLESFDQDSQGETGWKCTQCNYCTFASWEVHEE